jgi:hypothetical protein
MKIAKVDEKRMYMNFLLQCRNYSVIRDTTINFLNLFVPITAKLLLYGSTALTDDQNTL